MKRRLEDQSDEKEEKHDGIFFGPLQMFKNNPINETFEGYIEEVIRCIPNANPNADVFLFHHTSQPTGLIKLNDVKLQCVIKIKRGDNSDVVDNQDVVLNIPAPLRTIWKTKELLINHTLLNPSSNYEYLVAYMKLITTETPDIFKQSQVINLAILDKSGHFNHNAGKADNGAGDDAPNADGVIGKGYHSAAGDVGAANTVHSNSAKLRHQLVSKPEGCYVKDILDIPLFNGNNSDNYLPTSFDIKVRLTKANLQTVLMGSKLPDHAANTIANQKIHLEDFELVLPTYKPNERLRQAINKTLVEQNKELKYYTSEYRVIAQTIPEGTTSYQATDIFNGSYPARLYILLQKVANFDGSYVTNCFDFKWFNLNLITVKKNSNIVYPQLKKSQDAYELLKKNLKREYSQMPFTYEDYEDGYAIIMYDLTPNHDSYMNVLPIITTGNLSVELKFANATPDGGLKAIFIGDFRNQLQLSYQQEARRLYDY